MRTLDEIIKLSKSSRTEKEQLLFERHVKQLLEEVKSILEKIDLLDEQCNQLTDFEKILVEKKIN